MRKMSKEVENWKSEAEYWLKEFNIAEEKSDFWKKVYLKACEELDELEGT